MDRLIAANSVNFAGRDTAPASGTPQYGTDGVPGVTPATQWPAYQYNAIQDEIMAVIVAAGITPDKANWAQLLAAIFKLKGFQNINVYRINGGVQQVSVNGAAFTATGATSFPAPASGSAKVRIWGGGGGSGGTAAGTSALGGGGGGGEYAEGIFNSLTTSTTITVGTPGAAGSSAPGVGGNGGTTSFGALMTALGGTGGNNQAGTGSAAPGPGGTGGTGGTLRVPGFSGGLGIPVGTTDLTSQGGGSFGVTNGIATFGGNTSALAGAVALFPGGGGGGSGNGGAAAAGASGCVIVEY